MLHVIVDIFFYDWIIQHLFPHVKGQSDKSPQIVEVNKLQQPEKGILHTTLPKFVEPEKGNLFYPKKTVDNGEKK